MASNSMRLACCAILLVSNPLSGCAAHKSASSEPSPLTVCEVDTPARPYAGQEVTIEGGLLGGPEHGVQLTDSNCHPYGLPADLLPIKWPAHYSPDSGIGEFESMLFGPDAARHVGEWIKCICSGKMEYLPSGLVRLDLEKAQVLTSKDGRHYERIHD